MNADLITRARKTSIETMQEELKNFEKNPATSPDDISKIISKREDYSNDREYFPLILGPDSKYHKPSKEDIIRLTYYCYLKFKEEYKEIFAN